MEMQCKMYVKDYCPHSKEAAKTAVQRYGIGNVFVMCVNKNYQYVDPCNFNLKGTSCPFDTAPYDENNTVPQIYLKEDDKVRFIGGNDEFQLIANNTKEYNPPMNHLKL